MNKFRILIAEDESNWQDQLLKKALSLDAEVEIAATYEGASQIIKEQYLDLALIDLSLPSGKLNIPASQSPLLGINLLGDIRKQGPRNQHIGVVVISGMVDVLLTDKLKGEFDVFKVIDKAEGLPDNFLNILQSAILAGWLDRSDFLNTSRCRLTVSFSKDYLLSSELQGADRIVTSTSENPQRIDVNDLVRRADILNWMISNGGTDIWRPEAKSIGKAIYETITAHRHVLSNLTAARAIMKSSNDVWLEFTGPAIALGVPFELMRDEQDEPLALYHIMTRQIAGKSRKAEPFHEFIRNLLKKQERLNILIVGANSDNRIPAAEAEAELLRESIKKTLTSLGVDHDIKVLCGRDASYENIRQTLSTYECHIFHYAGHGRYDDKNPEKSGLVLRDGNSIRILAATELDDLVRNKNLRLVYLSSCTSARTADRAGQGDFYSIFDALAKADVPVVIGFRWAVADAPAMEFAKTFYDELWRTFSPGEALMKARKNAANGPLGRDDDTWLSPILMMHST